MTIHQGVRVTSSTAGTPVPGIEHLSGGYHYNKDPDWYPGHPAYRGDVTSERPAVTPERARRLTEFAGHRAQGLSIPEAGQRMGVKEKTAYAYERDWRHLQRQQGARS